MLLCMSISNNLPATTGRARYRVSIGACCSLLNDGSLAAVALMQRHREARRPATSLRDRICRIGALSLPVEYSDSSRRKSRRRRQGTSHPKTSLRAQGRPGQTLLRIETVERALPRTRLRGAGALAAQPAPPPVRAAVSYDSDDGVFGGYRTRIEAGLVVERLVHSSPPSVRGR